MDPVDHAAVVTGGASGLGEETAIRLARAGVKVAVFDLNREAARKAASTIGGIGIECDVSDPDSTTKAFKQAREKHGPARIVVNCAGIGTAKRIVGRDGPMPLNDFQRVISVNLIGTFNVMRLAAAEMATLDTLGDNERGVIIPLRRSQYLKRQIGQARLCSLQGGVAALTLPAAREFAQFGIRVPTIAPRLSETPMLLVAAGRGSRESAALFLSRASLAAWGNTPTWSCIVFKTLISMV
jgi:NAD(P)-dependent dehydrogenase (short-subunit alcohol dehydrogenase family)